MPTTIAGLYTVQGPTTKIAQLAADLSTNPAVEYALAGADVSDPDRAQRPGLRRTATSGS